MRNLGFRSIGCAGVALVAALSMATLAAAADVTIVSNLPNGFSAGEPVFVKLDISGLPSPGTPSLAALDIDLAYDDSALQFVDAVFGTALGDANLGEALVGSSGGGGSANVAEVSLLPVADLLAQQPAGFTMATVEFLILSLAQTTVDITSIVLGDELGGAIGGVNVSSSVAIPEPGSAALLALGVAALVRRKRRV